MDDTLKRIGEFVSRNDPVAAEDFFQYNRGNKDIEANRWLRGEIRRMIGQNIEVEKLYDLLKRTYLLTAQENFEDYMIYLEWDRPIKERFYVPRQKVLGRAVKELQALADGDLDELFLSQPPRTGKALANDTPILTRVGWKNHGDLVVGDEVIGMNGEFKRVIAVHPKCQLDVMVEFSNGEKIQCHENHEWLFHDRGMRKTWLNETKYWEKRSLENGGEKGHRGHRYVLQLPERGYIKGEHKDLGIDPYTFGVWLGDGTNNDPRICGALEDHVIVENIPYPVRWFTIHKTTGVWYYDFDIRKNLQKYGLCHSRRRVEKYIPEEFLTASIEQRLELLAGLLDTDGTLTRKERRYHFSTTSEPLRDGFIRLISTFGWRASVKRDEPTISNSGVHGRKPVYTIGFNPDIEIPCKVERKHLAEFSKKRAVAVTSIKRVEPKEGNCITVEGDGMYLCGHSMIPTHNTTMMLFYTTWLIGRDSEKANLYSAFSDTITKAFYNGVLEILQDPTTYLWADVFPQATIASTNMQEETLNITRRKRYASLTCRSLYGTLNGACDCNGIIVSDDLIGGIEEALNKDRLMSAWSKVDNNLLPRAKENAKRLWIGTRWSQIDPIGIRQDMLMNDKRFEGVRYKIINLPAIDEHGESNFDYDYGVGFSTTYYIQRRASFEKTNDMASWNAQYMGQPIERSGTLFEPTDFKYFNGELPEDGLVRKFMAVDPAYGGGDFTAAPICYQYADGNVYVVDVVYSNALKQYTQHAIKKKIIDWGVQACQFECTKATAAYKEKVEEMLKEAGYRLNITYKSAPIKDAKEIRVLDKAGEIKEFTFLEGGKRSKEYDQFMTNVFSFKSYGGNKHDDAPDSLAQAVEMMGGVGINVLIRKRVF